MQLIITNDKKYVKKLFKKCFADEKMISTLLLLSWYLYATALSSEIFCYLNKNIFLLWWYGTPLINERRLKTTIQKKKWCRKGLSIIHVQSCVEPEDF